MLLSCENNKVDIAKITDQEFNSDNHIEQLDLTYTDSGIVKLKLKAPVAIIHPDKEDPYKEFPNGIEVFFYKDLDTIVQNYLKGNYAINKEGKDLTEVRGNVIVVNVDGDTLKTEKLFWNSKSKKIYSDELVTITQKEQVIIGENGFEADEDFSYYKILNSSGNLAIDQGEKNE